MKIKILIIGLAALLTAGCLTSASKINAVQIGMTKEQVLKIMGPPASITADTNAVYLNYALSENGPQFGVPYVATPYEIKLVNGKVESYGRAGAPNSPNPVTMPVIVPMVR
jgi:hypothetical protein